METIQLLFQEKSSRSLFAERHSIAPSIILDCAHNTYRLTRSYNCRQYNSNYFWDWSQQANLACDVQCAKQYKCDIWDKDRNFECVLYIQPYNSSVDCVNVSQTILTIAFPCDQYKLIGCTNTYCNNCFTWNTLLAYIIWQLKY